MKVLNLKNIDDLIDQVQTKTPSFYFGSQTSTVIPYEKIESALGLKSEENYSLVNLSQMEKSIELTSDGNMKVKGAVTWQEARSELRSQRRDIMTSPTEELACILSGIATSATGERCFGYGTLRDQIISVKYINSEGELVELKREKRLQENEALKNYQTEYELYRDFKNAPFPRFELETDLMIGTEGQLGVIVEAEIQTAPLETSTYCFLKLPRWESDDSIHLDIFSRVQNHRESIKACELIDYNSLTYLDEQVNPFKGEEKDLLFLEIRESDFEKIYEELLSKIEGLSEDQIFQMDENRCRELRMEIPRSIFEANSKMGVVKKGTDVQVAPNKFSELLAFYRTWTDGEVPYNLFGHFGDAHLHFNFMPTTKEVDLCQEKLISLYEKVYELQGSPFAEHGIGILKKSFIEKFYSDNQRSMFKKLKDEMDPNRIFFPQGFMSL